MKLYYSAGACSLSPHIVLRELGNKFELEAVDLGTKKTKSGKDYTKINPKGYVPALELENGEVLTEGPAIVQYLADKANSDILPKAGTMERYRAMEMLNYITAELHKSMGSLFDKSITPEAKKATIEKISKRVDHLDTILGKHPYVLGDKFSVADAYAFTVLGWGKWVGVDISKWKNVSEFMKRMGARPAVQAALQADAA
ncbi:MAG: glutathione transferase GstA [Hyphomicrobiales bacterium]